MKWNEHNKNTSYVSECERVCVRVRCANDRPSVRLSIVFVFFFQLCQFQFIFIASTVRNIGGVVLSIRAY